MKTHNTSRESGKKKTDTQTNRKKVQDKEIQTCRDRTGYRDKERQTDKDTA